MKTRKTTLCAHFGPFFHIFMQTGFLPENLRLSLFLFLGVYCCEEFQKKNTEQIQNKNWLQKQRQTN